MNKAANALANAVYRRTGAEGVMVFFNYTFVVTGHTATRYQNSAEIRRALSAGDAEIGEFRLLAIQPGDELDAPDHDDEQEVLNDNVRRVTELLE